LGIFTIDVSGARNKLHFAEITERDVGRKRPSVAAWQGDRYRPYRLHIAPIFGGQAHGQREIALAFVDARNLLAADRGLDDRIDITDGESVAGGGRPIDADDKIGLAEQVERGRVAHAANLSQLVLDLPRELLERFQLGAENLDGVLT